MTPKSIKWICFFAVLLTFCVGTLGAYVRLSDAGLGCPDWPGCYGHPSPSLEAANRFDPSNAYVAHKAWKEMSHRYLAGFLGLVILAMFVISLVRPRWGLKARLTGPLLAIVIFQALLGMWTVTLKLHPFVVMAHLIGGFTTLSLLFWIALGFTSYARSDLSRYPLPAAGKIMLAVVILQIALGGWVSANYAAVACPDFPTCHGELLPDMDLAQGFHFWPETGPDYTGGALDSTGRVTIHVMHRIGAFLVLLATALYSIKLFALRGVYRRTGAVLAFLVLTQAGLGISNVIFALPLPVAVAHNAVAALVLLTTLFSIRIFLPSEAPYGFKRYAFLLLLLLPAVSHAKPTPEEAKRLGVTEKVGAALPQELTFTDEAGKEITLGTYLGKKPVIINPVYYECPSLCTLQLNGFLDSLKRLSWSPGKDFDIVTVSIDPTENSDLAAQKKQNALKQLGKRGGEKGWHFLVGSEENIRALTDAVGFGYYFDRESGEYVHTAAIIMVSRDGTIARYLHGTEFPERDLKFALMDAGRKGNVVDRGLKALFRYDAATRRYVFLGPKTPASLPSGTDSR
jgi:cytochrome c oxidase assembly protein subunit 15